MNGNRLPPPLTPLQTARAEIDRLRAERDALVKDAERYRYLRGMNSMMCCVQCGHDGLELQVGAKLDAAIDAARGKA